MRLQLRDIARAGDRIVVTLTVENVLAAHRIPTGGYAHRDMEVLVRLIGDRAEELPNPGRHHFTVEQDNAVAYREVRKVRIEAADPEEQAREVEITLRKLSSVEDPNPSIYATAHAAAPPMTSSGHAQGKDGPR